MRRERRFALEAAAVRLAERLVSRLPRGAMLALGRGLGRIASDLDRRHTRLAAAQLRLAFPHWDEARVLCTAQDVYAHFGAVLLDVLWLARRSREEILALVDVEGGEHVEQAMAAGRGVVYATCHIGNFELHAIAHGYRYERVGVVARPLDNPALDARIVAFRSSGGNRVIYKQRALQQLLEILRGRGAVAILVDQNVQEKDGVFVRFFDQAAATTTVAAALALKTGAALIAGSSRLGRDGRYRLFYRPALEARPGADRRLELLRLTQAVTTQIEEFVRAEPSQWLWMHRRWKTQPAPGAEPAP
jgi:Kdo2-lipid IVA lauroyltransferase/acyltransferase